jgi:hypothetical protein
VQGTAECHDQIADAFFPQADPIFDDAATFDTTVDMLNPQPTLVQRPAYGCRKSTLVQLLYDYQYNAIPGMPCRLCHRRQAPAVMPLCEPVNLAPTAAVPLFVENGPCSCSAKARP